MMPRPFLTCRQLIGFIADYVDGSLDVDVRDDFDRHLERCPSCRAYLSSYRDTIVLAHGALCDAVVADVPEDLVRTILARTSDPGMR